MSVLRSKIYRDTGLPDVIADNLDVWSPLHAAMSGGVSDLIGSEWVPQNRSIKQIESQDVISTLPDEGIVYSFLSADRQVPIFVHFDKQIPAMISSQALDFDLAAAADSYALQMLDLILFKPVKEILGAELSALTFMSSAAHGNFSLDAQGLTTASLDVGRGLGVFNEIVFSLKDAAGEAAGKKKGGKASTGLSFRVLLPQFLAQHIASTGRGTAKTIVLDQSEAWAEHIYASVKRAEVPIRAIVETCNMTVADCTRLEINDVIKLPGASLQSVSMQTDMREGAVEIGFASLGIFKSNWALKLSDELNDDIFINLKSDPYEDRVQQPLAS